MPISTVTNEDCMNLMSRYPDKYFDLAIVDPPYGNIDAIGLKDNKTQGKQASKRKQYNQFENVAPDEAYFEELKRVSKNQIVWGGNFFGLSGGIIAWNKYGTAFGEGEIAVCSTHKSVKFFEYTWNGMLQENMKNKEVRIHPTQKPVQLYKWCLKTFAKEGFKILDTHLGGGSHRIAAHDLGFDFVASELSKEFFDDQEKRFQQHISQTVLF